MTIRFSFDLGTNSIGWAVYKLRARSDSDNGPRPNTLMNIGVRLYSDGREAKTGAPLAAKRREPKSTRRRRDRTLQRRTYLLSLLEQSGLLPPPGTVRDELLTEDAYDLRARAATEAVSLHHFGRALWHLGQRRGFKSNRKADNPDEETGKIAAGGEALKQKLESGEFRTLGQFLASRQSAPDPRRRETVRMRLQGKGAQAYYDFYPLRDIVEEEFDTLWAEQAGHHSELTEQLREKIRSALFFQRPLKPVPAGRCSFFPDESRLARSTELAQEFIIYQTLNNLRVEPALEGSRELTRPERDILAIPLLTGSKLTWKQVRKLLDLSGTDAFNLERGGLKELTGNPIPARFIGTKKKPGVFFETWNTMPAETRSSVIEMLSSAETEDEIMDWAIADLQLDAERAALLAKVRLPDGHLHIGPTAASAILERMKDSVIVYSEAAKAAGLNHSSSEDGEFYDRLPPYNRIDSLQRHIGFGTGDPMDPPDKRYGKIANPTVHIALNQLRRVLNALIDRYGKPDEIVLEVGRELKKSQREKDDDKRRIEANRKANEARREQMAAGGHIQEGDRRIREKLIRMRLWEELGETPMDRRCPYTGDQISLAALMSDAVEIEHILPFSRTLDDSMANKTVSMLRANRLKRNLTPDEAAERYSDVFDLESMNERIRRLPANKRWRFEAGAMAQFEEQKSFDDRQLHATQYLSRIAREYVSKLFPLEDETGKRQNNVWVVTGKLTSLLRHRWGLNLGDHNRKDRNDHRHHAIDAAVIGVIDRSLIQRLSTIAAREEKTGVDRLLADLEEPFDGFADAVRSQVDKLIVSHRPNHGLVNPKDPSRTSGKLHEETYYGKVKDVPGNAAALERGNVVRRKPVTDLTKNEISLVRDEVIRTQLEAVRDQSEGAKELAEGLARWSEETGTRRVRVLKPEAGVVPINNRKTGEPYKYVVPAENVYLDIVETTDGIWRGVAMDSYAANTGTGQSWERSLSRCPLYYACSQGRRDSALRR